MLNVLKTLLIIKTGGYAVFFEVYSLHSGFWSETPISHFMQKPPFGVSEQNLFFCPTVQAVHLKNHCIATIFGDQKCFQHNQHLSAQKARFFKSDANSDFNS